MIGVSKCIISVMVNNEPLTMLNPVIVSKSGAYETEEGCLSLDGTRKTRRYEHITVMWQDLMFRKQKRDFSGFAAQTIQHEIDHLLGILI